MVRASPAAPSLIDEFTRPARMAVGIFDNHVPDHDPYVTGGFFQFCRDHKPDVVVAGGDALDFRGASSHPGDPSPPRVADELEAGRRYFRAMRKANPNATIIYTKGNHETRPTRMIANKAPTFDGVFDLAELLRLRDEGITMMEEGQPYVFGDMHFVHGFWTNLHHAKKHMDEFMCSVTYGHTHVAQLYTRGLANGEVLVAAGMPCATKLDPAWMNGKPNRWTQGWGVYFSAGARVSALPVLCQNQSAVWDRRVYGKAAGHVYTAA